MFGSIRILPRSDIELLHSRRHRRRRSMNRPEPQLAIAIEPLEGRTLLSAPVNFAACQVVGNAGGDLTAADFNGDGRIDLASANADSGTVSVLLNNGDGTFAPKVDYSVGSKPRQAVAADFNGDGKIDLAVSYGYGGSGGNGVKVLLNNGDGTFSPVVDCGTPGAPTSLTAADFNADGKADLAVGIGTGAEVFLNTGNGTFSPRSDYPAGLLFPSVATADVNGDGKIDLVIGGSPTDGSNTTLRVLRNKGDGTFALDAAYATLSAADAATRHDVQVIAADFDGDGRIDLAVAASASSSINPGHTDLAMLLNQGDGAFASKATYTWPGAVHSWGSADFNGDGRIDLAASPASVLINNGDGTFAPKADYAALPALDVNGDGQIDSSLAPADFNGDGRTDLAVSSYSSGTVGMLLNTPDRAPTDLLLSGNSLPDRQPAGRVVGTLSTVDPDAAVAFSYALVDGPCGYDNAFFTIDANVLKTAAPLDSGIYSIRVRSTDLGGLYVEKVLSINVSRGVFDTAVDYATGTAPGSVAAADFNGDGKTDLAVANSSSNTVSVLLNNGDGTFASKVDYIVMQSPSAIVAADFNGDGKPDLAVNGPKGPVGVLLNHGDGTFAPKTDYAAGIMTFPLASLIATDFNGDGRNDLGVVQAAYVTVLLNQGDGTFGPPINNYAGDLPWSVVAADFNGDGRTELAVANAFGDGAVHHGALRVLKINGDGTLTVISTHPTTAACYALAAADFNGDGRSDLAVTYSDRNVVSILLSNADGTFAEPVDYTPAGTPRSVAAADCNGDGKPDLVVANADTNTLSVFLNLGNATFGPRTDYSVGSSPQSIIAADFNADGRMDLAVSNQASNTVSVLLNHPSLPRVQAALVSADHQLVVRNGSSLVVSFGKVLIGRTGPVRTFRVTNAGTRMLTLGSVKTTRGFKVLQGLPKKLKPGQSATIKVRFVGDRAGTWSGRIRFASNDPLHNPFVISVSARRMRPATRSASR